MQTERYTKTNQPAQSDKRSEKEAAEPQILQSLPGTTFHQPDLRTPPLMRQDTILRLQRSIGNSAVKKLLSTQPKLAVPGALIARETSTQPSQPDVSKDQITQELAGELGSNYADYSTFQGKFVEDKVFGVNISGGIHSKLLEKLKLAEIAALAALPPEEQAKPAWGITNISGWSEREGGWHVWGLAIDVNYEGNPFIAHEAHEAKLDVELFPVYHRISQFILNRPSYIPVAITQISGTNSAALSAKWYDTLMEESNAMKRYFALMQNREELDRFLAKKKVISSPNPDSYTPNLQESGPMSQQDEPTTDQVLTQMQDDYKILGGQPSPALPGPWLGAPKVMRDNGKVADRPFDKRKTGPEQGFLNIKREIVVALGSVGLRWGAINFGSQSGDVMHFDDGNGLGQEVNKAKTRAQAKKNGAGE